MPTTTTILATLAVTLTLSAAYVSRRRLSRSRVGLGRRTVLLPNAGVRMPLVGLGTWQAPKGEVGAAVLAALMAGYRHIDCASCYGNEREVGTALKHAIRDKGIRRSDLFVTSKLWNSEHAPEHVRASCLKSLEDLGLEQLDLYIIHWPQQFEHVDGTIAGFPRNEDGSIKYARVPIIETWRAMEKLVDEGLVRAIGVSNFNARQVRELCDAARILPACNQVESHPFMQQAPLLEACKERGVVLTAYSPLGSGAKVDGHTVASHPVLQRIGDKHRRSAAQVAVAFQARRGVPTFPKSVSEKRLRQNLDVAALVDDLDADDLDALRALEAHERIGFGGAKVERNGRLEPRDLVHPDYPWNADGTERA